MMRMNNTNWKLTIVFLGIFSYLTGLRANPAVDLQPDHIQLILQVSTVEQLSNDHDVRRDLLINLNQFLVRAEMNVTVTKIRLHPSREYAIILLSGPPFELRQAQKVFTRIDNTDTLNIDPEQFYIGKGEISIDWSGFVFTGKDSNSEQGEIANSDSAPVVPPSAISE